MFGKLFGKHKETAGQIGPRPASNFGGGGGGGNQSSGAKTVEAIQKLGEVWRSLESCMLFCILAAYLMYAQLLHVRWCNDGPISACNIAMQTEELLMKRRTLLEKKCAQEAERAREQMKAKNKRGKFPTITVCSRSHPTEGMADLSSASICCRMRHQRTVPITARLHRLPSQHLIP